MMSFKKMLYLVNPEKDCSESLAQAVIMAEHQQATLTVMDILPPSVTDINMPAGFSLSTELQSVILEDRRLSLEKRCAPFAERCAIDYHVEAGTPFIAAIRRVLSEGYDLVIKQVENPSFLRRIFGTDDMHLLRKCPCPVWLIHEDTAHQYQTVVAAMDLHAAQDKKGARALNDKIMALSCSLSLAEDARLHVIHAWQAPGAMTIRTWSTEPEKDLQRYLAAEQTQNEGLVKAAEAQYRSEMAPSLWDWLQPSFHAIHGSPAKVIPEAVDSLGADLVVMGTLGRTGIPGLFIGNTAESILEQLHCGVLAVKPDGFVSPVSVK